MSKITLLNCDCLEYMAGLPDKAFDLCVCDPPYGIEKEISRGGGSHTASKVKFHNLFVAGCRALGWGLPYHPLFLA